MCREPGFNELSDKMRADILLDRATRYEQQLDELKAVVSGERPAQILTLGYFGSRHQWRTLNCPDTKFTGGVHDVGARRDCPSCAVDMMQLIADKLSDTKP